MDLEAAKCPGLFSRLGVGRRAELVSRCETPVLTALLVGCVAFALVVVGLVVPPEILAANTRSSQGVPPRLKADLSSCNVRSVVINTQDKTVHVTDTNGVVYSASYGDSTQILDYLTQYPDVRVTSVNPAPPSSWPREAVKPTLAVVVALAAVSLALVLWLRGPARKP